MTLDARIGTLQRAAAGRALGVFLATGAPLMPAAVVVAARVGGVAFAVFVAVIGGAALALGARRAWRGVDVRWTARRLDALVPGMEDSAALLWHDEASMSGLRTLQRERLRARLPAAGVDLRTPWPWRRIGVAVAAGIVGIAAATWWPSHARLVDRIPVATGGSAAAIASTRLVHAQIDVEAPAYTGLGTRGEPGLETRAPQGALLRWRLRFDPAPQSASLAFHDGSTLAMTRDGDDWTAERRLDASTLYRIALSGAPALTDDRLYRIDAIADRPPDVHVSRPDKTLTLLEAGQKTWDIAFEASDDYAVARADLDVTLAQGTGENITFKQQTIALAGEPVDGAKRLRFVHTLDLAALGIAQGDDVIVKLAVGDNREPQANVTRSASFILRWPVAPSSESAGMEGIVQKTMPAYFRSQRQIIIDSEALIAEQPGLDEAKFMARADALGVDQKILRLRYGQFLGEEADSHAAEAKADLAGASDAGSQADGLDKAREAHEKAQPPGPAKFGEESNVVAEYGHVHDESEAATLLDPETKAILKSALSEMWQSELHLRQGDPVDALPYEHRALEFIKQVQQSTRIYLARVGLELPAPDEARRLSGERKGLLDVEGTLVAARAGDGDIVAFWASLGDDSAPDWSAAATWIGAHEKALPDALGVLAAIDRARRDPACRACRTQVRDLLWPALPTPAAASAPRPRPDAAGRAYLEALQPGGAAAEDAPR